MILRNVCQVCPQVCGMFGLSPAWYGTPQSRSSGRGDLMNCCRNFLFYVRGFLCIPGRLRSLFVCCSRVFWLVGCRLPVVDWVHAIVWPIAVVVDDHWWIILTRIVSLWCDYFVFPYRRLCKQGSRVILTCPGDFKSVVTDCQATLGLCTASVHSPRLP